MHSVTRAQVGTAGDLVFAANSLCTRWQDPTLLPHPHQVAGTHAGTPRPPHPLLRGGCQGNPIPPTGGCDDRDRIKTVVNPNSFVLTGIYTFENRIPFHKRDKDSESLHPFFIF